MNFEHLRVAKSLEKYIQYLIKIVSLVKTSGNQFTKFAKLTILNNRFD